MKLLKYSAVLGLGVFSLVLGSDLAVSGPLQEGWMSQGWPQWHPQKGSRPLSTVGTQVYFGEESWRDSDGDGVPDGADQCPDTPKGTKVDSKGCPVKEPEPVPVARGIEPDPDSDGDGVPDKRDQCPNTPRGTKVDSRGCPLDVDSDGDGVVDRLDKCPDTPKGASVTSEGCWVIKNVNFQTARWDIPASAHASLNEVVKVLQANPGLKFQIQGHTDNRGGPKLNGPLSEKRAKAVQDYLVKHGIPAGRLSAKGFGATHPLADNKKPAGQAENRRVELKEVR
ncbi:MAG: OmpA family protein [Magnetococcales bacterium]|nr:OmpA family protein [Magnetococcales bacterium]